MVLYVVALVLEELDDGVLGEIQLSREGVDGFLIRVEPHIMDKALQDTQSFQGDLGTRSWLFGTTVLSRWRRSLFSGWRILLRRLGLLSVQHLEDQTDTDFTYRLTLLVLEIRTLAQVFTRGLLCFVEEKYL